MDFQNKVVIITNAPSGIGLTTARLLAKKGARLAFAKKVNMGLSRIM